MIPAQAIAAATGATPARAQAWAAALNNAMAQHAINTPARAAAFLAQVGHESGGLRYVAEIWGPTRAQLGYEGRADLGNTRPGDGYRYRGRGLIQLTGRANYIALRDGLPQAPDFEQSPDLLMRTDWAALSAGWYWAKHDLSALADAGSFDLICRRINGGANGLAERRALFGCAQVALGCA